MESNNSNHSSPPSSSSLTSPLDYQKFFQQMNLQNIQEAVNRINQDIAQFYKYLLTYIIENMENPDFDKETFLSVLKYIQSQLGNHADISTATRSLESKLRQRNNSMEVEATNRFSENAPQKRKIVRAKKQKEDLTVQEEEKRKRGSIAKQMKILNEYFYSSKSDDQALVNPNHTNNEPNIFLPPELSDKLKPYQLHGVRFLYENMIYRNGSEGCLLADNMGLGKTLQVISIIYILLKYKCVKKILLISPSTAISNWIQEFQKWLTSELTPPVLVMKNSPINYRHRLAKEWSLHGGVLIVGYEMFRKLHIDEKFSPILCQAPDLVIVDEAHRIGNPQSKISEALSKITTTKRIGLTGYPMQNNLIEYWAMINFLKPCYLGTLQEFRNFFENPIKRGLCSDSLPSDVLMARRKMYILSKLIEPFCLRRDSSYLIRELPPKSEFIIFVNLSPFQTFLYKIFLEKRKSDGQDGNSQPISAYSILNRICNHPDVLKASLSESNTSNEFDEEDSIDSTKSYDFLSEYFQAPYYQGLDVNNGKKMVILLEIIRLCKEKKEKVLVFSQSLKTLDLIAHFITNVYSYSRIDGSTTFQERSIKIKNFNSELDDVDVFLLSTKACSLGINLTAANRVVIFDVCWNPSHDIESLYRVYRYGQTKPVFIYRLVSAGTMEARVFSRQILKQTISKNVVDGNPTKRILDRSSVSELFDFKETSSFVSQDQLKEELPKATQDSVLMGLFSRNDLPTCIHQVVDHDSLLIPDQLENLDSSEKAYCDELIKKELNRIFKKVSIFTYNESPNFPALSCPNVIGTKLVERIEEDLQKRSPIIPSKPLKESNEMEISDSQPELQNSKGNSPTQKSSPQDPFGEYNINPSARPRAVPVDTKNIPLIIDPHIAIPKWDRIFPLNHAYTKGPPLRNVRISLNDSSDGYSSSSNDERSLPKSLTLRASSEEVVSHVQSPPFLFSTPSSPQSSPSHLSSSQEDPQRRAPVSHLINKDTIASKSKTFVIRSPPSPKSSSPMSSQTSSSSSSSQSLTIHSPLPPSQFPHDLTSSSVSNPSMEPKDLSPPLSRRPTDFKPRDSTSSSRSPGKSRDIPTIEMTTCPGSKKRKAIQDPEDSLNENSRKKARAVTPCKFYHLKGGCHYGSDCHFLHGVLTREQLQDLKSKVNSKKQKKT